MASGTGTDSKAMKSSHTGSAVPKTAKSTGKNTSSKDIPIAKEPHVKDSPSKSNVQTKITELESKLDHGSGQGQGLFMSPSHNRSAIDIQEGDPSPPSDSMPTMAGSPFITDDPSKHDISSLVAAINAMHGMIYMSQSDIVLKLENRFSSLKTQIDSLHERFECHDQAMRELVSGSVTRSDLERVESNVNTIANRTEDQFSEINSELASVKSSLDYYRVENLRLKHRLHMVEESLNVKEIKSKRYSLYIEGLLEVKDKDQKLVVLEKLNKDANVNLQDGDIVSAKRMGKVTKFRKNRPISVIVKSEEARDKVLKARGKLSVEVVNSPIWINEDIPQSYRRRKSMLRDLVKLAQSKKHRAKIEHGGINLDGKLYLPHQFHTLPEGLQPKDTCLIPTEDGGTAFASEWSYAGIP